MTSRAIINGTDHTSASSASSSSHPPQQPHSNHLHNHHHRQQHRHQQQQQQRYHSSGGGGSGSGSGGAASFKGCCCCLFLLLTFLGLLVIAVILVIVLAVKPKKPQFELQQVAVQYVGITQPTPATATATAAPASASLSLSIRMVFTAVNPNKVGIKYSASQFYVMYRGVPLGLASVPGFFQPAHSVREVQTTVAVDRVNLLQADAADLVKDATLNDRVELRITGDVGAKIRILDLTSPRVKVSVDCAIVISPRKQSLTYKQCGVDGLSV